MENVATNAFSSETEDLLSDAGMQQAVQHQVEQWLRLLQRVREHGNVALACSAEELPRPTYYRVWRQFRAGGIPGLSKAARRSIERSSKFRAQVDEVVIAMSRANPRWGRHRVSKALQSSGKDVSARQVWCVWKRHDLLDRSALIAPQERRDDDTVTAPIPALAIAPTAAAEPSATPTHLPPMVAHTIKHDAPITNHPHTRLSLVSAAAL